MYTLLNEEQKQIFELKRVPDDIREGDYAVFIHQEQVICETPYQEVRTRFSENTLYELFRIKKITKNSVHIYNDIPHKGCYYSRYRINHDYEELNKEYPPPSDTYHDTIQYFVQQRVITELYPHLPPCSALAPNKYYFRIRQKSTCLSYDPESNSYDEGCLKKVEIYNILEEYGKRGWCDACWFKHQNNQTNK